MTLTRDCGDIGVYTLSTGAQQRTKDGVWWTFDCDSYQVMCFASAEWERLNPGLTLAPGEGPIEVKIVLTDPK